jgi:hypothetical protein
LLGRPAPLASLRENGTMRDDVLIDRFGAGSVHSGPSR